MEILYSTTVRTVALTHSTIIPICAGWVDGGGRRRDVPRFVVDNVGVNGVDDVVVRSFVHAFVRSLAGGCRVCVTFVACLRFHDDI